LLFPTCTVMIAIHINKYRAIFWTLKDQLPERVGNHPLFRLVFGWMCPPYVQFLKMFATSRIRHEMKAERVYQDIVLPLSALEDAIDLSEETFDM
jgi:delta24-sterol reductase